MAKKLAIPYIRMSTKEQLKGHSLERQTEAINKYCRENDLEADWTTNYIDIGKSAYKGENLKKEAGLGRILGGIEAGIIKSGDIILIENLDRLTREEVQKALMLIIGILQKGVEIRTIGADRNIYNSRSKSEELIIMIISLARSFGESERKQELLLKSWAKRRKKAEEEKKPITKRIPAWLNVVDEQFQVDIEKGKVVQRIINMKLDGYGSNKIAYILNDEDVPVFGRGKKWHESYIKKIISNKALLGVYTAQKLDQDGNKEFVKEITDYYPKLISKDDFNRINIKRDIKGRKSKYFSNLFTGIATCKKCGSSMVMINKGSSSKGGKYLLCSNVKSGTKDNDIKCDNGLASYKNFELNVLRHLDSLDVKSIIDPKHNNDTLDEIKELELQISNISRILNNIQKSIDDAIEKDGVVSSYLNKKEAELSNELKDFEIQLNQKKIELNKNDISRNNYDLNINKIIGEDYILRAKTNIELKSIIENMTIESHGSYNKKVVEVDLTLIGGYRIVMLIDKTFIDNTTDKILTIKPNATQKELYIRANMNIFKEENSFFKNVRLNKINELIN